MILVEVEIIAEKRRGQEHLWEY